MGALANHPFVKMNGLGNAIVVVDLRAGPIPLDAADARAVAAAVPFDQMMVLYPPRTPGTDALVRIFNTDGSQAGACGNGTRCIAALLFAEGAKTVAGDAPAEGLTFEIAGSLVNCWRAEGEDRFTVDMGRPRLRWDEIPLAEEFQDTRGIALQIGPIDAPILHTPSVVSMGNPHAVFWVDDVNAYDLARIGPLLENHPIFPQRANISLAHAASRQHLIVRTWERGAGLTLACGSAACAAAVSAVRTRRTERAVTVTLPGGDLAVEWREADDHVRMTGPVEYEFAGRFDPAAFAARDVA